MSLRTPDWRTATSMRASRRRLRSHRSADPSPDSTGNSCRYVVPSGTDTVGPFESRSPCQLQPSLDSSRQPPWVPAERRFLPTPSRRKPLTVQGSRWGRRHIAPACLMSSRRRAGCRLSCFPIGWRGPPVASPIPNRARPFSPSRRRGPEPPNRPPHRRPADRFPSARARQPSTDDVRFDVRPDELRAVWDELVLAPAVSTAWAAWFARLRTRRSLCQRLLQSMIPSSGCC